MCARRRQTPRPVLKITRAAGDVLSSQECVDFVRRRLLAGERPARIAEQVFDECISEDPRKTQGIGGDNMTCVIVQLNAK